MELVGVGVAASSLVFYLGMYKERTVRLPNGLLYERYRDNQKWAAALATSIGGAVLSLIGGSRRSSASNDLRDLEKEAASNSHSAAQPPVRKAVPGLPPRPAAGPPRILITDSNSWEMSGGFAGGARPQTVEIIKTFRQRCTATIITMNKAQAQFVVLLDHEGGKGRARRDNKIAVFMNNGDLVHSGSTRSLGNAVKDACAAVQRLR